MAKLLFIVIAPLLLSSCLAAAAIGATGAVVGAGVKATGEVVGAGVHATGAVVGAALPGDHDKDKHHHDD